MRLRNQVMVVVASTAFLTFVTIFMMYQTTPQAVGPNRVTLWFLSLLLALTGVASLILLITKRYLLPESTLRVIWYASLRQGFLVAGWVTTMLGLSSLRQLTLRDGFLTAVLLLLVELYVRLK
jgi:hypothetical protein